MPHESSQEPAPPFPAGKRVVFEIHGGDSDGQVFDSRDANAEGGTMAGHLWFVTGGGTEGREFDGRSIAGSDRMARSLTGRADEPYPAGEERHFVVGKRTEDADAIHVTLRDATKPGSGSRRLQDPAGRA